MWINTCTLCKHPMYVQDYLYEPFFLFPTVEKFFLESEVFNFGFWAHLLTEKRLSQLECQSFWCRSFITKAQFYSGFWLDTLDFLHSFTPQSFGYIWIELNKQQSIRLKTEVLIEIHRLNDFNFDIHHRLVETIKIRLLHVLGRTGNVGCGRQGAAYFSLRVSRKDVTRAPPALAETARASGFPLFTLAAAAFAHPVFIAVSASWSSHPKTTGGGQSQDCLQLIVSIHHESYLGLYLVFSFNTCDRPKPRTHTHSTTLRFSLRTNIFYSHCVRFPFPWMSFSLTARSFCERLVFRFTPLQSMAWFDNLLFVCSVPNVRVYSQKKCDTFTDDGLIELIVHFFSLFLQMRTCVLWRQPNSRCALFDASSFQRKWNAVLLDLSPCVRICVCVF